MPPPDGTVTLTVLGSGTSVGVPTIGCHCKVCTSDDPRDKRLRPSVLVEYGGRSVLIDTTPDLRQQVLRARIERLDAILFTHAHADHIMGLDDVRPFNFRQSGPIPIYASGETVAVLERVFLYVFDGSQSQSSRPRLVTHHIGEEPFELFGIEVVPIPLAHGHGRSLGFRFGPLAYLTDHSEIPASSKARLAGLDVLFLDGLRHKPHPTHTTVTRALQLVEELRPGRTFLTHICHDLLHRAEEERLPPHVRLAYDGLVVAAPAALSAGPLSA